MTAATRDDLVVERSARNARGGATRRAGTGSGGALRRVSCPDAAVSSLSGGRADDGGGWGRP